MSTIDDTIVSCNEKDKETLLTFKKGIIDCHGRISTWTIEKDCCVWEGIHCDNNTGRVTRVELPSPYVEQEQLKYLQGEMNLSILKLEFLTHLDLSYNYFNMTSIPSNHHNISHVSKLLYLDLSWNDNIVIDNLEWLSPISSLKYLNLSGIYLHKETNWIRAVEQIPSLFELRLQGCNLNNLVLNASIEYLNLSSLITLDLSRNNFNSHLPIAFFNLTKDITYLDLHGNNIQGEMPSSLLNLSNLRHLDLSLNNFSGEISKTTFSKFNHLDSLDLGSSNFVFQFDFDWVSPFQLSSLVLSHTNQGPNFPTWIYTQNSLESLYFSSSGISVVDRNKFPSFIQGISYLDLSNNSISVDISNLTLKVVILKLDHNNFTGKLPNISPMTSIVDLSFNTFSGSIPHTWNSLKQLDFINLWSNRLSGEVSMDFSSSSLYYINLGKNEFVGTIPINLTQNLQVIILRANKFEGKIPLQLFNLSHLYHLDLAYNKLSGSMPKCVYNLTHMVTFNEETLWFGDEIDLYTKGQDYVFEATPERRTIDLSSNSLSGNLPSKLFQLVKVQSLNLSHNNFTGTIPKTVGRMKNIESLDLSSNKLYGEIPQSMILLNFLDYFNLSNNNLKGKIPVGTQLQSFDASSYTRNPNLCGAPLNNCTTEEEYPNIATLSRENDDGDSMIESLYFGMGVGFAIGFWGICGSLFLIKKWRQAYFQFVDGVGDKIYVALMVKINSFIRN